MNKIINAHLVLSQKSLKVTFWLFIVVFSLTGIACKNSYALTNDSSADTGKAYIIQLSIDPAPVSPKNYDELLRYHFYGIAWNGKVDDNLKFARQIGFIGIVRW